MFLIIANRKLNILLTVKELLSEISVTDLVYI